MPLPRVEAEIAGTYQLDALLRGWRPQRAWHRARLDLAALVLPPDRHALSLDLAAGAGILTWRFPESPIISVDLRAEACRAVRRHTPGARALVAELGALPFQSATFSQVYFLETIEHLAMDEARRVLGEIRRISQPGGRCLFTTPNYRSYWGAVEWLLDALRLTPPMSHAQHVSRYDSGALSRLLDATGWRVLRSGSFNLFAPIAGTLSSGLGTRAIEREARGIGNAGGLLYAVCEAVP